MKILELECTKDEMERRCEGLKIKFEKAEESVNLKIEERNRNYSIWRTEKKK